MTLNSKFYLRAGETGDNVQGTAGFVLTAQADGTWKPAAASSGAALSAVWFVDKSAAAGGTGKITAPFNTFAAAIAAAQADFTANARDQTIVVTGADYSAEGLQTLTLAPGNTLTIAGWATPLGFNLSEPQLPQLALANGSLVTDGVAWTGVAVPQVDVPLGSIAAIGSYFQSVNVGDKFRGSLCQLQGGTIATSVELDNSTFGNFTTGTAHIRSCRQFGLANITGDVTIDAYTNAWGAVTATGTLLVFDKPAQERISVVVPAVLAGQVGYVDTAFAAQLANVPANTPLTGNPTADLVAAGAGGGFINCRVSAAGTVRCAFIGPLAGGAVDFVFAALAVPV